LPNNSAVFLWISGFLKHDAEDDTLKYDFIVKPDHEQAVLDLLGWASLDGAPDGEWLLSDEQIEKMAKAIGEQVQLELDIFISVRA
jgi:hypothetical protein